MERYQTLKELSRKIWILELNRVVLCVQVFACPVELDQSQGTEKLVNGVDIELTFTCKAFELFLCSPGRHLRWYRAEFMGSVNLAHQCSVCVADRGDSLIPGHVERLPFPLRSMCDWMMTLWRSAVGTVLLDGRSVR